VIAVQLRTLASDPTSQKFMCSDPACISGLMTFLDSKDDEVLTISLQALHFLSSHPANREALSKQPGLLVKLVNMTERDNKVIKQVASQCLENLQSYVNGLQEQKEKGLFSPKYLYTINLSVIGLAPAYRPRVEKALIGVKGVVSVTFDDRLEDAVTVYCAQKPDEISSSLLTAVESLDLKLSATLADKENLKTKRNTSETSESSPPSTPPTKQHSSSVSYASQSAPTYFDKTNVRRGSLTLYNQHSTLKERQAEQRRRESEKENKQSSVRTLFGKVTSYFW